MIFKVIPFFLFILPPICKWISSDTNTTFLYYADSRSFLYLSSHLHKLPSNSRRCDRISVQYLQGYEPALLEFHSDKLISRVGVRGKCPAKKVQT